MNRCAMCWLERDNSKLRAPFPGSSTRVCGRCSLELDRALGFFQSIGVVLAYHDLKADDPPKPPHDGRKEPSETKAVV